MAVAITPSLRASLERLKHAGTVNGVCLSWRRQVLVNVMPFEDFRVEQLVQVLNDARDHFQGPAGERIIETLWMAYTDVHVLTVFAGECAVIMLHVRPEESDFLTGVAQTFLNDAQLMITAALNPPIASDGDVEATEAEEVSQEWYDTPRLDPDKTNVA